MRARRFLAIVAILILAAFVVAVQSTENSQSKEFKLGDTSENNIYMTIKAKNEVVRANTPILVSISIKNVSDHSIGKPYPSVPFEVRDSQGNKAPLKKLTVRKMRIEDISKLF